ncbi:MAG: hypothetical protein H6741_14265 [Alphaproteobacteria bacterium]|nr:hypothetical protein [Alphaproteobacteria bacterium]MCB9793880.1 hypothetical protein [Alphaproteobacteria bacterium]
MSNTNAILAVGGLIIGAIAGAGVFALVSEPETVRVKEIEEVAKELTAEEVEALCGDQLKDERSTLQDAQAKVVDLQSQLEAKEAELAKMQKEAEGDAAKKAAAAKKWKEMEQEIESLREQLQVVEQERDELLVELKETVVKLENQIKETEVQRQRAEKYKDESQENLWTTFYAQAKVEICDRGSRRRHDKCHDAVNEALNADNVKPRFLECVDTYQSTPLLIRAEDRRAELPMHAIWLSEDSRFTNKGWMIQFCDPTLPEAGERPADRAAVIAPTGTIEVDDLDGE